MTERYAIGIDFGGTNIKGAVVDSSGHIVCEGHRPSLTQEGSSAVLARMGDLINELAKKSPAPVVGVGVGSPGPLSCRLGVVHTSPNLPGWNEVPVRKILKERTGFDVALDNDANCAALGESLYGIARGCRHMVMLTFGTGIGGGLIVDGNLVHGRNDGAAELGHFIISKGGPKCACGNLGCFEAHCSASAVARRGREAASSQPKSRLASVANLSALDVTRAADSGDEVAKEVIAEVSEDMAIGVAGLVNIFNPEMVVLAGGLMRGGNLFIEQVRAKTPNYCFPAVSKDLRIELSILEDRAGIVGAASLVTPNQPRET